MGAWTVLWMLTSDPVQALVRTEPRRCSRLSLCSRNPVTLPWNYERAYYTLIHTLYPPYSFQLHVPSQKSWKSHTVHIPGSPSSRASKSGLPMNRVRRTFTCLSFLNARSFPHTFCVSSGLTRMVFHATSYCSYSESLRLQRWTMPNAPSPKLCPNVAVASRRCVISGTSWHSLDFEPVSVKSKEAL